ncbi:MAG: hypothetical protein R3E89_03940 [Thiolinea sp.]
MDTLATIRQQIRSQLGPEAHVVRAMLDDIDFSASERQTAVERACDWVRDLRAGTEPGLMESFLAEYGLSAGRCGADVSGGSLSARAG